MLIITACNLSALLIIVVLIIVVLIIVAEAQSAETDRNLDGT